MSLLASSGLRCTSFLYVSALGLQLWSRCLLWYHMHGCKSFVGLGHSPRGTGRPSAITPPRYRLTQIGTRFLRHWKANRSWLNDGAEFERRNGEVIGFCLKLRSGRVRGASTNPVTGISSPTHNPLLRSLTNPSSRRGCHLLLPRPRSRKRRPTRSRARRPMCLSSETGPSRFAAAARRASTAGSPKVRHSAWCCGMGLALTRVTACACCTPTPVVVRPAPGPLSLVATASSAVRWARAVAVPALSRGVR